jgi:hypothetical protein
MRDICDVSVFVETGTYHGDTARAVAPHFERVLTVEGAWSRYWATWQRTDRPDNVQLWFGRSEDMLGQMLDTVGQRCLIFLDAHWVSCGEDASDDPLQLGMAHCPLGEELRSIDPADGHVALIDNVRFFTHPPKARGPVEQWLSLDQIAALLPGYYLFTFADILAGVPNSYRGPVREWLQENWRAVRVKDA